MYVRDHQRPAFHEALGIDPAEYGQEVFAKTSELSKQIFPITLDIENPRWNRNLVRMQKANVDLAESTGKAGLGAKIVRMSARFRVAKAFIALYAIPSKTHQVPESTRLEPVW